MFKKSMILWGLMGSVSIEPSYSASAAGELVTGLTRAARVATKGLVTMSRPVVPVMRPMAVLPSREMDWRMSPWSVPVRGMADVPFEGFHSMGSAPLKVSRVTPFEKLDEDVIEILANTSKGLKLLEERARLNCRIDSTWFENLSPSLRDSLLHHVPRLREDKIIQRILSRSKENLSELLLSSEQETQIKELHKLPKNQIISSIVRYVKENKLERKFAYKVATNCVGEKFAEKFNFNPEMIPCANGIKRLEEMKRSGSYYDRQIRDLVDSIEAQLCRGMLAMGIISAETGIFTGTPEQEEVINNVYALFYIS